MRLPATLLPPPLPSPLPPPLPGIRLPLDESSPSTARLTAGFCWEWSDPIDGRLVDDVVIGDWRRPWNLKPEKRVAGIPSSSLWASDPAGIDQVGCIYTAQGFEYDYGGVVIGQDMVWRNGGWITDSSKSSIL